MKRKTLHGLKCIILYSPKKDCPVYAKCIKFIQLSPEQNFLEGYSLYMYVVNFPLNYERD